jgi:hypothetical protein
MTTWLVVAFWVVVAAVAVGAYLERRRGRRNRIGSLRRPASSESVELESRRQMWFGP